MRTTQRKGDIAKCQAISTFTKMGYDVGILLTESASYDIIVDVEGILHKVQVKYSTSKEVDLRCIHSNSKGYVVNKYKEKDFDWLYVYTSDENEYLIKKCLFNQSTYTLRETDKI